jgi:hypothetical protein
MKLNVKIPLYEARTEAWTPANTNMTRQHR